MAKSRPVENKCTASGTKMSVGKDETEQDGRSKDKRSSNKSGQKLPCHQQLPPHRREKIIVQAFLHDLPAEQPGEQAHAAEENSHTQIKYLEGIRQYSRVFLNTAITAH